jgi:hypothetical protein
VKYFKAPNNEIYFYDSDQQHLVDQAIANGWEEVTHNWADHARPHLSIEQHADIIRKRRDDLLKQTDWVIIKALEQGKDIPLEWAEYRQALRDLPEQPGFPQEVMFPIAPNSYN